ncbi:WXG100 family type VII secretion target [Streptomyces sp. BBFR2]|uniref:WXG100 family type VII secretion target n=1 Tax=Streptomyces sp. BBFR2 TaxID=3372854 RepID=UPI0037D9E2DB
MSDEVRTDTEQLHKLGAVFEKHADDLARQLTAFRRRADATALHDGFGGEEAARSHVELYEQAERALGQLRQRLAEVGGDIRRTADATQAVDDELATMIRSVG